MLLTSIEHIAKDLFNDQGDCPSFKEVLVANNFFQGHESQLQFKTVTTEAGGGTVKFVRSAEDSSTKKLLTDPHFCTATYLLQVYIDPIGDLSYQYDLSLSCITAVKECNEFTLEHLSRASDIIDFRVDTRQDSANLGEYGYVTKLKRMLKSLTKGTFRAPVPKLKINHQNVPNLSDTLVHLVKGPALPV